MAKLNPGSSGNRFTPKRKEIYLAELRRMGRKPMARLAANISPNCVKLHRERHPEFAEAETQALTAFNMAVHEEIRRRGIEGVAKPVTVAGKKEMVRDYSDRLLLALAKSQMTEYRDRVEIDQKTEHSGTLSLEADLRKLSPRGQELLRELLELEEAFEDEPEEAEAE